MRPLLASLALLAASPASADETGPRADCATAADCVITTFSGCCGSCCPKARAVARARLAAEEAQCAVVRCAAPVCAAVVCEPSPGLDDLEAQCRAGRCVAVERGPRTAPPPVAECRQDRECAVIYPGAAPGDPCQSSPCGCCPGTEPRAAPVARAEPRLRHSPRAPGAAEGGTPQKFGLSQGSSALPAPACAPCPAPRPARAVCARGRCALAPAPPIHRD